RSSPPTGTPAARIGPARLTCLTILRPHHMLLRLRRTPVLCALAALLAAPALAQPAPPQHLIFPDLEGEALVAALRAAYTPPATLGYDAARDVIFQWEQDRNGGLRCVYTGYTIALTPGADPSADAYAQGINTEHTWPRSRRSRRAGAERPPPPLPRPHRRQLVAGQPPLRGDPRRPHRRVVPPRP